MNDVETDCFVDSGSSVSVISKRFLSSLHLVSEPDSSIPVNGIGGPAASVGRVTAMLQIGSIAEPTDFHIFDIDTTDLMIGTHDAARFHLVQDHRNNTVFQNAGPVPSVLMNERVSKHTLLSSLDERAIFAESMRGVGRITIAKHRIEVPPGQPPIFERCRRTSLVKQDHFEKHVRDLLDAGLIRPSDSPWAAPVIFSIVSLTRVYSQRWTPSVGTGM